MRDEAIKAKLRDPAYFALHVQAAMALRETAQFRWYDSFFLHAHAAAIRYLERVRPDVVERFVAGFAPLRPDPQFSMSLVDDIFDATTRAKILEISHRALPQAGAPQDFENANFGRDVLWNDPLFNALQEQIRPRVEQLVGQPLDSSYTFLSRYFGSGVCAPHLDHPDSMFTFDYCIEQSDEWPIHFSQVVDWPTPEEAETLDLDRIKDDPALTFTAYSLQPGQAVIFNGSAQWHYRDPITPGGSCKLLFFHYVPKGCADLAEPRRWDAHFAVPELGPLCDTFATYVDERVG